MELRDTIKDAECFEEYVASERQAIAGEERELEGRPSNSSGLEGFLALDYGNLLWAMYSAGCPVANLKPVFSKWLECRSLRLPGYMNPYYMESLYSVAALLGTSERDRWILQSMSDAIRGADAYASFIAPYLGSGRLVVRGIQALPGRHGPFPGRLGEARQARRDSRPARGRGSRAGRKSFRLHCGVFFLTRCPGSSWHRQAF